jgi:hypothetical protein
MVIWIWTTYNSLINLLHRVEQGWSQVDIQLKRRHDLIPNLVSIVAGYKHYESETQPAITAMRSQMEATPPGVTPLLGVVIERYPDLQASESLLKLQKELSDTEQRIALARDYFNDVATFYNTRLGIIPDRYVAVLAKLHPAKLMSSTEFERAPVKVNLAI